ncbi:MAG TPA: hypothetical protein VK147_08025 [Candidatus Didemnitutus sp.]|nr:hypothetical protein [Candidatus Didemnitutus sp.]
MATELDPDDKVWVVSADMGYGHMRAAFPFRGVADGGVIAAGDNELAAESERKLWRRYLRLYEVFSRAKGVPLVGKQLFGVLDSLLHIPSLYPIRNLSHTTYQVEMLDKQLKRGLGAGIARIIEGKRQPLLTSFYVPALVADKAGHEPIYCIICDADLNRVWVAKDPWESSINYFVPCGKAAQRLKSYGVSEDRIFLTGFPLDDSLLGGRELSTLKSDLSIRLKVLDPNRRFHTLHGKNAEHFLGPDGSHPVPTDRVLTITYAVGGAGALKEIGASLLRTFKERLQAGTMQLNLVAGTRDEVRGWFEQQKQEIVGRDARVKVIYGQTLDEYFTAFNLAIRSTDVLWTKPSELSFYAGLGLPVIMTPTIGSQEKFNRKWLLEIGSGMRQENPDYANEWLFDLLDKGRLADMAWLGFLRARKLGYYHILDVLRTRSFLKSDNPLHR